MKFIQKLSEERRQQNSHSVLNSGTDRRASSFRHSLRNYAAAMILPANSTLEMGMHKRPQCGKCRARAGVLYLYKRYIAALKPISKLYRSLISYIVLYVL